MTERELREGMTLATANEPPLVFDPDALMARAQREARRRRSLMGVGVATAVVAVAAVAVSTTLTAARPQQRLATGAAVLSTTRTTPARTTPTTTAAPPQPIMVWPPANPGKFTDDRAELAKLSSRWTTEVVTRMPKVVPKATKIYVQPWQGEAAGPLNNGQDYLGSFIQFTIAGHRTAMFIQVNAPGTIADGPNKQCSSPLPPNVVTIPPPSGGHFCRIVPGPAGTALVIEQDTQQADGQHTPNMITVRHYRQNGTSLMVSGYNYNPVDGSGTSSDPTGGIPLTEQQLTAFATDPVLDYVTG